MPLASLDSSHRVRGFDPLTCHWARQIVFELHLLLGPPARCPTSHPFFDWEGSPTKTDYRK